MLAPICLFTYNRLDETQQTVEALKKNQLASESKLIIFSDGPKNEITKYKVEAVRNFLKTINGFKAIEIIESPTNKGLANSIIDGVTQVIEKYEKVIVMEDDLITSSNFLDFMNQALTFYQKNKKVRSISAFTPLINTHQEVSVHFQIRTFPWGWATWADRWDTAIFSKEIIAAEINNEKIILNAFEKECGSDIVKMLLDSLNNKNDSWYVRWVYKHFRTNTVAIYPKYALVYNAGFNENGTHCKTINPYKYKTYSKSLSNFNFEDNVKVIPEYKEQFLNYFSKKYRIIIRLKLLTSFRGITLLWNDIMTRIR